MKAAIYARKSTDDNGKSEENKSVIRQAEQAKAYAESKGWSVDPDHIYMDDGISGKVFDPDKRRGLARMMAHLKEFDAIIMMDPDRLGRDQQHTPMHRAQIIAARKRLFYLWEIRNTKGKRHLT